jgi:hypothetical protein
MGYLAGMIALRHADYHDYKLIAERLRTGVATEEECRVAAAVLDQITDGTFRKKKGRPTSWEASDHQDQIHEYVCERMGKGDKEYIAVKSAAKELGLSETAIRKHFHAGSCIECQFRQPSAKEKNGGG